MSLEENPKAKDQETEKTVDQIQNEIREVPMGDVLLAVFDQFIDPSKIFIYEDTNTPNKYNKRILANVKEQIYPISLVVERLWDDVKLTVLNISAERYSAYINTVFLNKYVEFLAGKKETGTRTWYPLDNETTYGISMRIATTGGLRFPSEVTDTVLKVCQAVSQKSLELYQVKQPQFFPKDGSIPLPLRK